MIIYRKQIFNLLNSISLLEQNEKFPLLTKYKVLRIKEILEKEMQYNSVLIKSLTDKYGEKTEDGDVRIKKEFLLQADEELREFNNDTVTLPDLYFTLDELENTEIPWTALESFLPFIKD